jgi:hypothetical protein
MKYDRRTRKGREREIIEEIKERGCLSCFWISDSSSRAAACERLEKRKIVLLTKMPFPMYRAKIIGRWERCTGQN